MSTSVGCTIRPLAPRDLDAVMSIQAASPEIAQWSIWDYERVARREMAGWAAEIHGEVAGFLVGRRVGSDLEILNLAVRPDGRRCGVGGALLQAAISWGQAYHAENVLLEVRASNVAALRFYERHSFEVVGRRPRYYTAPVEDALLLTASLKAAQ
ncbi:MAG TPA: ribosomal protein S18-alanine N-acetyltransferase [archaeon]|nr:ribosomal protein S18-alanine N-acetyltransferase [archaeon]